MQWTLYVATASCMALAASDCIDLDFVSALGNFGLFAVLLRFYLIAPKVVAIVKKGSKTWIKSEENYLKKHFPWYDVVGKIGWGCLTISVFLQIFVSMN